MTDIERHVGQTYPIDVLREQIAPGATDLELAHFANVCHELDLSPWADQIVLIGRYDKRANKGRGGVVHRHQITVAGRRALATRTGRPYRVEGPMWCGPRNEAGDLVWVDVWDQEGAENAPYAARCLVYFTEFAEPAANGTAKWSEFAQYDSNGKPMPTWRQMPSHMLGKVAESLALRRAFPEVDRAVASEADYMMSGIPDELGDARAEVVEAQARNAIEEGRNAGTTGASPDLNESAGVQAHPPLTRGGPGDPVAPEPSPGEQALAHRAIARFDEQTRERWLADWRIDDFGAAWPPDAVADALSRRPSS
jgi:hypothetical protein